MSNHGSFSGNPKTEWLVDESGADRNMRLLEDFLYTDPNGKKWPAPSGSIIDGASIPRPLWTTVGSPYTDDYRRASVVHDVACDSLTIPRKDADVIFYPACIAGGDARSFKPSCCMPVFALAHRPAVRLPPMPYHDIGFSFASR